ncbi:hypothetical protein BH10PAT3_BH10PAT3_2640 [soil metagenome]
MDDTNPPITESDSLETSDSIPAQTQVIGSSSEPQNSGVVSPDNHKPVTEGPKESFLKKLLGKVNVYFLLLILVLIILGGIAYYAVIQNRKNAKQGTLNTQKLTQSDLDKLAGTDSSVGDAKQTLTVVSNAIFTGGVLVRGNIDVAGSIKIGGPLSLPGLSVGGNTSVDQLAAKSLTVAGDAAIQGKVAIQNNLTVTGSGSFSGNVTSPQVTTNKLQLNGDLQLSRHVTPNGASPGRTNGGALGGGGTASNSGNDITGTVNINTGNAAPAGCFVTITFSSAYATVPHVIISPSSSTAATVDYYVNRSASGFSICTANDPPDNAAGMTFDYIVLG